MTVDLNTLKVGDSIRLRNGEVHEVIDYVVDSLVVLYPYVVVTKQPRAGSNPSASKKSWVHAEDGSWLRGDNNPGDIVEIIPAEKYNTLSVDEFTEARESLLKDMADRAQIKEDAVMNPAHYQQNGKQLWNVMPDMGTKEEFLGYCKFNVIKYVNRYNKKNGVEDLRKAIKYCERMVEFLENGK